MNTVIKPLPIIFKIFILSLMFLSQQANSQFTWSRTFGGAANDEAFSSEQTNDGNYIVVGDSGYGASSVIIKFSKQGDVLWKKIYSGTDRVYLRTAEDPNGNLYFNTLNGILKMDPNGNTLWRRNFNITISFQCLKFTGDSKFLFCYGNGSMGKIDSSGKLIWYKNYANTPTPNTFVIDFTEINNAYYITGIIQATAYRGFIRKLDTAGNDVWTKFTGDGSMLCSIVRSSGGSVIVSGNAHNYLYCRKLDLNGNTTWERSFVPDSLMNGYSIIKAGANKFALATGGYGINSRFILMDSSGNITMNKIHYYSSFDKIIYLSINNSNDSGFVITGYIKPSNSVTYNWLVVKTDKNGNTIPIGISEISATVPEQFKLYQNYPNPFNPSTKIKFEIPLSRGVSEGRGVFIKFVVYDITGSEVYKLSETRLPGTYEITFNAANYSTGMYFYTLEAGEYKETKKMVLIK